MLNYDYDGKILVNEITFSQMFELAKDKGGGPQPMVKGGTFVMVAEGQGKRVAINETDTHYAAIPLLTCAGVIFSSTEAPELFYLYHAPSGTVSKAAFQEAMDALKNPALDTVHVIYTFPNKSDAGYLADANEIIGYGVPKDQFLYAPDLTGSSFGINTKGLLG